MLKIPFDNNWSKIKIITVKKAVYSSTEIKSFQRCFLFGQVVSFKTLKIPPKNPIRLSSNVFLYVRYISYNVYKIY